MGVELQEMLPEPDVDLGIDIDDLYEPENAGL